MPVDKYDRNKPLLLELVRKLEPATANSLMEALGKQLGLSMVVRTIRGHLERMAEEGLVVKSMGMQHGRYLELWWIVEHQQVDIHY